MKVKAIKFTRPKPIIIPSQSRKQSLVTFRDIGDTVEPEHPVVDITALREPEQNDVSSNEERKEPASPDI